MLHITQPMYRWRRQLPRLTRCIIAMALIPMAFAASRVLAHGYDFTPFAGALPAGAVEAGTAADGSLIHICLVASWGGEHPGALRADGRCEVPWGGQVHEFTADFEVLVGGAAATWVPMGTGGVPDNAFAAGDDGGPIFVCRADAGGGRYPGKLGEDGWCYLAADGRELTLTEGFEVLVD